MFYMIDEGKVLPVQREMKLRSSMPMREVNGLSFILIYLNIVALAPRPN
jgi:hypothetical protein